MTRRSGERSATIVDAIGGPRTVQGRGEGPIPIANDINRYIYEPAAAVLAAKLTHVLCDEHQLQAVSNQAMYLTGEELIRDPALAGFEVLEVLPLDERQLKAWLRQRGIGRLEEKKRGVQRGAGEIAKETERTGRGGGDAAGLPATRKGAGDCREARLKVLLTRSVRNHLAERDEYYLISASQTAWPPNWPLRS